jgi:hypothetical protein
MKSKTQRLIAHRQTEMSKAEFSFSQQFRKAKTASLRSEIKQTCTDETGAKIWNMVKKIRPQTNKRSSKHETYKVEATEEAEQIADNFEKFYNDPDLDLN